MADEQDGARKIRDQLLEQFERLDVEVVGRLVHHEDVGRTREQAREHQAVALSARQRLDRRYRALARKQEVGEVADDVPRLPVDDDGVVAVVDAVGDRLLRIELLALLVEVRDPHARAAGDRPCVGLDLPRQQLEQRRLAGAVGSDEADAIPAQDALRVVAHDLKGARLRRERLGHMVRLEDQPARRLARVDRQAHVPAGRALGGALGAERHERADTALVAGPPCLDALPQPRLFLLELLVESIERQPVRILGLRLLVQIAGVGTRPGRQLPAVEIDDTRRERREERAVVRHEQQRAGELAQVVLQPADRVDVEVVRRLVEQEQIGL